jgi:hypothetical protein
LEIFYKPMTWDQLLNNFQFTEGIYLLFFFITGLVACGVGAIVWGINRLLTRLRHPPPFHGMSLMLTLAQPAVLGVSLGAAPLMFAVLVIWVWFTSGDSTPAGPFCLSSTVMDELQPGTFPIAGSFCMQDLTDWAESVDMESVLRPGRQQLAILFVGVYATFVFARLVLPKYSDQDRLTDMEREALKNKAKDKKAATIASGAAAEGLQ